MFSYILVFILLSTQYFQLNSKYWETRCTADTTPDTLCYDWTDNKLNSVLLCQWLLHNPTQPKPKPNGCVLLLHSSILYYTTYPKAVPQSLGCAHNSNLRFLIKHCSIFEAGETDHWPLSIEYNCYHVWMSDWQTDWPCDWLGRLTDYDGVTATQLIHCTAQSALGRHHPIDFDWHCTLNCLWTQPVLCVKLVPQVLHIRVQLVELNCK